jgi:hypothetical protein
LRLATLRFVSIKNLYNNRRMNLLKCKFGNSTAFPGHSSRLFMLEYSTHQKFGNTGGF